MAIEQLVLDLNGDRPDLRGIEPHHEGDPPLEQGVNLEVRAEQRAGFRPFSTERKTPLPCPMPKYDDVEPIPITGELLEAILTLRCPP